MTPASPTWLARARLERSGLDQLDAHLASAYGIEVSGLVPLDVGVFRVDRRHGPPWVARVFPADRPRVEAEGDARVLERLAEIGFPAERCAASPAVSMLDGQAVLVTEHLEAVPRRDRAQAIRDAGGYARLGAMLGRLHRIERDGRIDRPGGCWHHLGDGGPAQELSQARLLLADAKDRVDRADRRAYEQLRSALEATDDAAGLPEALVHPDFVLANVIAAPDGRLVVVDWTGAGWAPRVWSLAWLLYTAAATDLRRADRVLAGYRREVSLEATEIARLAGVAASRAIVLEAWGFCLGRKTIADAAAGAASARALAHDAASRL